MGQRSKAGSTHGRKQCRQHSRQGESDLEEEREEEEKVRKSSHKIGCMQSWLPKALPFTSAAWAGCVQQLISLMLVTPLRDSSHGKPVCLQEQE